VTLSITVTRIETVSGLKRRLYVEVLLSNQMVRLSTHDGMMTRIHLLIIAIPVLKILQQ